MKEKRKKTRKPPQKQNKQKTTTTNKDRKEHWGTKTIVKGWVLNDFLEFLNNRHHNIKFMIENQINHCIAFLDVFISGINNQNLTLQAYHKSTYTGQEINFKSFTSFSYKISLIKCLIERSFKICNSWKSFHNDIEYIKSNLIENTYPPFLIDKVIFKIIKVPWL